VHPNLGSLVASVFGQRRSTGEALSIVLPNDAARDVPPGWQESGGIGSGPLPMRCPRWSPLSGQTSEIASRSGVSGGKLTAGTSFGQSRLAWFC